jgi:hypothetical protein
MGKHSDDLEVVDRGASDPVATENGDVSDPFDLLKVEAQAVKMRLQGSNGFLEWRF